MVQDEITVENCFVYLSITKNNTTKDIVLAKVLICIAYFLNCFIFNNISIYFWLKILGSTRLYTHEYCCLHGNVMPRNKH